MILSYTLYSCQYYFGIQIVNLYKYILILVFYDISYLIIYLDRICFCSIMLLIVNMKGCYLWRTEQDYYAWSNQWFKEAARVLRKGGSFYLFGYFRMLSYLLPILESNGFKLRQQIILNKEIQAVSGRAIKNTKCFLM